MSIDFAEDAIHALNRAAAAAAREDGEAIAPGHILAGAISERDPALLAALEQLGLDIEDLPDHLRDAPEVYDGHLPFTPDGHEVLAAAIDAAGPGHATSSAHLLAGVARAGDEESRGVLEGWGMKEDALTAALGAPAADQADDDSAAVATVVAVLAALGLY